MIPKIFHRVVPAEVPEIFARYWDELQALHPGWDFKTWSDPLDPNEFESGRLFGECTSGAQLAGLVRLEVVHKFGGIYIDMDVEPLRPFDDLLKYPCFIATEDGRTLTDAVFGAVPSHPGIRSCLDRAMSMPMSAGAWATGPGVATKVLSQRDDVEVLPPQVFYPYNWNEPWKRAEDFREGSSLAVHRWNASWTAAPGSKRPRRLAESDLELAAARLKARARIEAKGFVTRIKTMWSRQEPQARRMHGTYIGGDRVLISTTLGLPLIAAASDLSLTPELMLTGEFDSRFLKFVSRFINPGSTVVDVGANIGFFTLSMAQASGPHGHVYAIESNPAALRILTDNVTMNCFDDRVTLFPVAAGRKQGHVPFTHNPPFLGGSFVGEPHEMSARPSTDSVETFEVDSARLDEILSDCRSIALVKIDVEGREVDVLAGLTGLLDGRIIRAIDLRIIEEAIGDRWPEFEELLNDLVHRRGAVPSVIGRDGQTQHISLNAILSERNFLHVIFGLPS
jgi:FkbM family methyltransferase